MLPLLVSEVAGFLPDENATPAFDEGIFVPGLALGHDANVRCFPHHSYRADGSTILP